MVRIKPHIQVYKLLISHFFANLDGGGVERGREGWVVNGGMGG